MVQGYTKKIIPVQVLDAPSSDEASGTVPTPIVEADTPIVSKPELVDIPMSNGVHISQKNLSCTGLKNLVEKLEGLC